MCFPLVKYGDTYTHKNSRFGSPTDLDSWKAAGGDPHVIPSVSGKPEEWPIRAVTRMLAADMGTVFDCLPERAALLGPITITVTSSAGKEAKIDDAPHSEVDLPTELLARSSEDRKRIAAALAGMFDKSQREHRQRLIPHAVPTLLMDLSQSTEPEQVVSGWLETGQTSCRAVADLTSKDRSPDVVQREPLDMEDDLREPARRLVRGLARLSRRELMQLRPHGGGRVD